MVKESIESGKVRDKLDTLITLNNPASAERVY
jgi:hypothetical protein